MIKAFHSYQFTDRHSLESASGFQHQRRIVFRRQPLNTVKHRVIKIRLLYRFDQIAGRLHAESIHCIFPGNREKQDFRPLFSFPDPSGQRNTGHMRHNDIQQIQVKPSCFFDIVQQIIW